MHPRSDRQLIWGPVYRLSLMESDAAKLTSAVHQSYVALKLLWDAPSPAIEEAELVFSVPPYPPAPSDPLAHSLLRSANRAPPVACMQQLSCAHSLASKHVHHLTCDGACMLQ